jgi:sugar phosphate isomerase/epimerase
MRPIGFSTGAVAKGDFESALTRIRCHGIRVVELSALRFDELASLVQALDYLDLSGFDFISFHCPSRFSPADESHVIRLLQRVVDRGIPVIVHPDVIFTPEAWQWMGASLLLENMDKRNKVGRSARDLENLFERFPQAGFCFDLGHARQFDPTMIEARLMLESLGRRLKEIHISEVNSSSRHDSLSLYAISAFRSLASLIPEPVPIILETLIDQGQSDIPTEIDRARRALEPIPLAVIA